MSDLEREVCVCFHVQLGKLVRFYERRRLSVATQFSECQGAGGGCGWCIPHLESIFEQLQRGETPAMSMSAAEYKARRAEYWKKRKPELPPPPDAAGPLDIDLDEVLDEVPEDMKLD
jgi:bacterioferritin-associated ferredoxin